MSGDISVRNEAEHNAALARIDELMDAHPDTMEGRELDALVSAVEEFESRTVETGSPSIIAALEFRMEQAGLCPEDLISCIGSKKEVSEVLDGERPITPSMARALQECLGIPAGMLLAKPNVGD